MSAEVSRNTSEQWWRDAVVYQVYPRSFADSDGDGAGDLPGVTSRLDHLSALGVDAIWLSPFYVSPQADAGYDVADYRDVDPMFGTLADAEELLRQAKARGIRFIVDLVPNHTSDEHTWFVEALAAPPGSPERELYIFRDGRGPGGAEPPNNWQSVFGGPAWTRVTDADGSPGPWYLHLFDVKQPDLNWEHPQVREEFLSILRFWLERGVDGFRVDVAHGLVKALGLPDAHDVADAQHTVDTVTGHPAWDQVGVHEVYRGWRAVLEEFPGSMMVAEAWVEQHSLADYLRPDEFHQAFNFGYLEAPWRAADQRAVIRESLAEAAAVGAPTTWVLSNHDVVRHATRLALPPGRPRPNGIGPEDPQPDPVLGLRRATAATLLMVALPGSAYLYQGEELGLPEHTTLPLQVRQDPTLVRTGGEQLGRDGCRVPLPWVHDAPGLGFGPSGRTWLPQPEPFAALAADLQDRDPDSVLALYRTALRLRREHGLGRGELRWRDELGAEVVAFENSGVLVVTNFGSPIPLPQGRLLLASGPVTDTVGTDQTVWLEVGAAGS